MSNTRIVFLCTPDRAPLEAEQVLRSFGIKVSNRSVDFVENDLREAKVFVPSRQHKWAASLIAGEGFTVIEPLGAKGTKPRSRWGDERRSYTPQSIIVYIMEALLGAQYHRRAPIKNQRKRK